MPKIVDHDERREHIARSMTNIIIRDGFDRVTMREIAAEAGYTHGAIARYFPDKQSLLTEAFLRVFTESHNEVMARIADTRGLEALERMSRQLMPFSSVGVSKSRLVLSFWDRASQDNEMFQIHESNLRRRRELIRRLLTEASVDGELGDHVCIETAVDEVSARNAGWQMLGVLMPEAATDERLEASLVALIDSLRPRE